MDFICMYPQSNNRQWSDNVLNWSLKLNTVYVKTSCVYFVISFLIGFCFFVIAESNFLTEAIYAHLDNS